jgi:hypothetical protein
MFTWSLQKVVVDDAMYKCGFDKFFFILRRLGSQTFVLRS